VLRLLLNNLPSGLAREDCSSVSVESIPEKRARKNVSELARSYHAATMCAILVDGLLREGDYAVERGAISLPERARMAPLRASKPAYTRSSRRHDQQRLSLPDSFRVVPRLAPTKALKGRLFGRRIPVPQTGSLVGRYLTPLGHLSPLSPMSPLSPLYPYSKNLPMWVPGLTTINH